MKVYTSPWRFDLEEIKVPVCLWHGERDTIVPSAMARRNAAKIPRSRATFFPEDGHYSILFDRKKQILETLLETADEVKAGVTLVNGVMVVRLLGEATAVRVAAMGFLRDFRGTRLPRVWHV